MSSYALTYVALTEGRRARESGEERQAKAALERCVQNQPLEDLSRESLRREAQVTINKLGRRKIPADDVSAATLILPHRRNVYT